MGYSTQYQLQVSLPPDHVKRPENCLKCGDKNSLQAKFCSNCGTPIRAIDAGVIIADLRSTNENAKYGLTATGSTNGELKWYEHDADMKVFSRKYPNAIFTLNGEGEESGDVWQSYYKNGKSYRQKSSLSLIHLTKESLCETYGNCPWCIWASFWVIGLDNNYGAS